MILAGDIGGTNTRLAVFDEQFRKVEEKVFQSAGRGGLVEIVAEFLKPMSYSIDRACFGVAGPVAGGKVTLTNLSWTLDENVLSSELRIPKVALINDLMAHAEGIEVLRPEQIVTLNPGDPSRGGNRAVIAAGTGLGEAGLFWDSKANRYRAFASEGGHADFSPRNDLEIALLKFLHNTHKHVSWENVLSGPGLKNIYDFYVSPAQAFAGQGLAKTQITPSDVTAAALEGSNAACVAAMDLFVSLYGSAAGNLALKMLATGGVYLGGGIAPRIIAKLRQPAFLESFRGKGVPKIAALLAAIPVHVINFEFNGLYGAANYAHNM